MFLVHRRDLPHDGKRPVLLTGYGGFNISLTPAFDPSTFALLDRGGVIAVANLRGGGEYGEAWHQAGMFERKQNVFDDFIAAAEWLVRQRVHHAAKAGDRGRQQRRPADLRRHGPAARLFGAVVCRVPVADMLRYHLFTVGRFWISEYGSADDPAQFPYLLAYSPYHNVRDGVAYPPDPDHDRGHRRSCLARHGQEVRRAAAGSLSVGGPSLIRVETKAGHGAGKPVSKVIEEEADMLAFLFKYLEVR